MSGRKVKFKLEQPGIMCSGRSSVTCTYRGRVVEENEQGMEVKIKVYGNPVVIFYDKTDKSVLTNGFEDLKLI